MADTGWVVAGSGENLSPGDVAWSNPENITNENDADSANASGIPKSTGTTQYLHATNFAFVLPNTGIVTGIEARTRVSSSPFNQNTYVTDHTIQLIVGGSRVGDNKANTVLRWPSSAGNNDYGGPTDLWSVPVNMADIKSPSFGLAVRATNTFTTGVRSAAIYTVWMRVHYEEEKKSAGAFFALFSVADRLKDIIKPKQRFWLPEPEFCR